jgi:hypothetical protein
MFYSNFLCLVIAAVVCNAAAEIGTKFHMTKKANARKDFVLKAPADADAVHELVFAVKQKNLVEFDKVLMERSTPGKPMYQKWLSFDEVGAMTSNPEGAAAVVQWLTENNIAVKWTSAHKDYIKAEAKISQWEKMLNTKFHLFEDLSRKNDFKESSRLMHRAHEYSLPETMSEHLSAVFNTVQVPPVFKPKYRKVTGKLADQFKEEYTIRKRDINAPSSQQMLRRAMENKKKNKTQQLMKGTTSSSSKKDMSSSNVDPVTVQFLNNLYDITTNNGKSTMQQSVFETADEMFSPDDLAQFQTYYNLRSQTCEAPYGFSTTDCTNNDCGEGNLDVQYIMGISQKTTTIYWYVDDGASTDPFVAWVTDIADSSDPPETNSMSWGSVEQVQLLHMLCFTLLYLCLCLCNDHALENIGCILFLLLMLALVDSFACYACVLYASICSLRFNERYIYIYIYHSHHLSLTLMTLHYTVLLLLCILDRAPIQTR